MSAENCLEQRECNSIESAIGSCGFTQGLAGFPDGTDDQRIHLLCWRPGFKSLGWEDPLEKGMAGYPLQYSFLENSMGRGAFWATVLGVTTNWTGLWD